MSCCRLSGLAIAALVWTITATPCDARDWTDSSGHYRVVGDMIAFSDTSIVLKKQNGDLVAVPIEQLSMADQEYLKTEEAAKSLPSTSGTEKIWTMKSGLKVPGRIVDYAKRDVTIQRRLGQLYVNDMRFDKLPSVYQEMVPRIVAHFTSKEIDGQKGLDAWARTLKGQSETFKCEGVLLELEDGQLYGVPFFFFSDENLEMLRPGWERWVAAQADAQKQQEQSFYLQAQAQAYEQEKQRMQQVQQLQLNIQAYDAGLFDLWEVALYPPRGAYGMPLSVVVPARNSLQATDAALRQNPGYVVGPIRKVPRLN